MEFWARCRQNPSALVHRPTAPVRNNATGGLNDGYWRLHIISLQSGLDDQIDRPQSQQGVCVAIHAVTRQLDLRGQRAEGGTLCFRTYFWKCRKKDGAGKLGCGTNLNWVHLTKVVQLCRTETTDKTLTGVGLVNNAKNRPACIPGPRLTSPRLVCRS